MEDIERMDEIAKANALATKQAEQKKTTQKKQKIRLKWIKQMNQQMI